MPQDLEIIGCKGNTESVEKLLREAQDYVLKFYSGGEVLLQFLDADKVLGKEHILSAIEHAYRAFERKENISSTKAMEILIYVAGEPQINSALAKVGIRDGCERIVLIVDEKVDIEGLLTHLSLKRDDEVLECKKFKLREFGITDEEISAMDEEKLKDLVLERVAMVDVRR
jgi:KEOPS complex subunit Cgi121